MSGEVDTLNLDMHAAETSQKIVNGIEAKKAGKAQDTENLVTKALGVLQENGVYACALFLYARTTTDKNIAKEVRNELFQMTAKLKLGLNPPQNPDWQEGLKFVSEKICDDLDKLLLIRQLWEQTLIYARYGAKAWKEDSEAKRKSGDKK
ncbi:MAG: hypothetical protein L0229_18915 [Blastocatellia bacterium]|nr:hypothetical protein [Blastocatellia bacterium]